MINKIIVENFRCFNKCHEIELRPLTFLVGENSTGKTSLLAAIKLATNLLKIPFGPYFNREPFMLGAYEQIASFASGRTGRARNFRIGFEKNYNSGMPRATIRISANFVPKRGLPNINEFCIRDKIHNIESRGIEDVESEKIRVTTTSNGIIVNQESTSHDPFWSLKVLRDFATFMSKKIKEKSNGQTSSFDVYPDLFFPQETTYAFAPVRTRPDRTYDPRSDIPLPEGSHIPMVLRSLESQVDERTMVKKEVEGFGSASGLFKQIRVRYLGRGQADPFQILVKIAGPGKNLIDVGYGVSQVLPILVDTLVRREQIFLMQQPEIHLHPRAQATLGTFFGHLARTFKKQLIVETHSDHIIDRVLLDIRDKTNGIVPNDVIILFFQRKPNQPWVKVHKLTIDERGNIQGAPKGYRDFFLKEQARLFEI